MGSSSTKYIFVSCHIFCQRGSICCGLYLSSITFSFNTKRPFVRRDERLKLPRYHPDWCDAPTQVRCIGRSRHRLKKQCSFTVRLPGEFGHRVRVHRRACTTLCSLYQDRPTTPDQCQYILLLRL